MPHPSTQKKYLDFSIYIGRFQPFHTAHLNNVQEALKISSHLILGICASNLPMSQKNPWSAEQRKNFIRAALSDEQLTNIDMINIDDVIGDNDAWTRKVLDETYQQIKITANKIGKSIHKLKVGFVGVGKDPSTIKTLDRLKEKMLTTLNPFTSVEFILLPQMTEMDATSIRKAVIKVNEEEGQIELTGLEPIPGLISQELKMIKADHEIRKFLQEIDFQYSNNLESFLKDTNNREKLFAKLKELKQQNFSNFNNLVQDFILVFSRNPSCFARKFVSEIQDKCLATSWNKYTVAKTLMITGLTFAFFYKLSQCSSTPDQENHLLSSSP
jgi:cytidyltransferase-like protein